MRVCLTSLKGCVDPSGTASSRGVQREGKVETELDRSMQFLITVYGSFIVKRERSQRTKLSIYQSVFIPNLNYTRSW